MSEWEEENEWEKAAATEKWDDKKNIRNVLGIFLMPLNKEAAKAVEGESSEKNEENKKHTVGRRWWKKEEKEEVKKKKGLAVFPSFLDVVIAEINSIPQMVHTFKRNYPKSIYGWEDFST